MSAPSPGSPAVGHRLSPSLAAGWPHGLLPRPAPIPRADAPDAALLARLLDASETETALALFGEALLGGAPTPDVIAAARQIFLHRAAHPLAPDPGLAALLAALAALDPP